GNGPRSRGSSSAGCPSSASSARTSRELVRAWVLSTLAGLAADDEYHARLRDTLLVFLQSGGSYKTIAARLTLHKNTLQYRIRNARESLGGARADPRQKVELPRLPSHWLGSYVLRPAAAGGAARTQSA